MNSISTILQTIKGKLLTAILVTGYIDRDNSYKQFHPMFDDIYFDFEGVLIRASATSQFWYIQLELVKHIEFRYKLEDGDELCVSPLDFLLRVPSGNNYLKEIVVFSDKTPEKFIQAIELRLECRSENVISDTIFLDPRNDFGIHLGKEPALAEWKFCNANFLESIYR